MSTRAVQESQSNKNFSRHVGSTILLLLCILSTKPTPKHKKAQTKSVDHSSTQTALVRQYLNLDTVGTLTPPPPPPPQRSDGVPSVARCFQVLDEFRKIDGIGYLDRIGLMD